MCNTKDFALVLLPNPHVRFEHHSDGVYSCEVLHLQPSTKLSTCTVLDNKLCNMNVTHHTRRKQDTVTVNQQVLGNNISFVGILAFL